MEFLLAILLLIFSFYALARVVDVFFIETLEIISAKLRLSSDIAGATFMAAGSSAAELFVAIMALLQTGTETQAVGAGTIVGSAIFNILVIVGASALYRDAKLTWQPVVRDLLFYVVAIVILLFTFVDGSISLVDALIYVVFYIAYLFSFKIWRKLFAYDIASDQGEIEQAADSHYQDIKVQKLNWKNIFDKALTKFFFDLSKRPQLYFVNFLISVAMIALLSYVMVEAAVVVASGLGVSQVVIGLTILAAGTSVPDLLSSINVAKKGKGDMAVANAVGSNIFDIAIGLGLPWFILILVSGQEVAVLTENLNSSIVLLFATVLALAFLLITKRWNLTRYAGFVLILVYVGYLLTQIGWFSFNICFNPLNLCFAL